MASSEENSFEDNWRSAFKDASETPLKRVWEQIEERLDEKDDRVVIAPFWQQWQSLKWVAAAGVTALLVSLAGWWLSKNELSNNLPTNQSISQAVQADSPINSIPQKAADGLGKSKSKNRSNQEEKVSDIATVLPPNAINLSPKRERLLAHNEKNGEDLTFLGQQRANPSISSKKESIAVNTSRFTTTMTEANGLMATPSETILPSVSASLLPNTPSDISISTPVLVLSLLENKKMQELVGLPKRQPWVAYQAASSVPKVSKIPTKTYWTSVGVAPASYNAGISITKSQVLALASQGVFANTNQSGSSANQPLFSYLLQWQGGVQLAQRWSLETGLNYLQGNSVFEGTNGFNVFTNSYINNLEAAINASDNTSQRFGLAASSSDKSQIQSLTTSQNINTSYQFLQVPVQAGYALLKPKRKLSLWFLAGLINNIFLKNSFESGQKHTISISSPDSPYRILSFSGSTGLRLQYKMSKRWSSQLTGNYQLALGTTTKTDAAFEARPHLLGVGAGLRYGF